MYICMKNTNTEERKQLYVEQHEQAYMFVHVFVYEGRMMAKLLSLVAPRNRIQYLVHVCMQGG